jgi:hypothetical protein
VIFDPGSSFPALLSEDQGELLSRFAEQSEFDPRVMSNQAFNAMQIQ